ncbi:hypothetical protein MPH_07930 [Macrophomina phaseolina MS6]|uniref:Uncharacterized protein n=1 Tax=Macrophomina phaseolina (strain MS6) TaxID=1126212 RepID=K2SDE7_MACPH|nr:hypothetical protein MPH_07930 [Macrophomina phaseolina MS6]
MKLPLRAKSSGSNSDVELGEGAEGRASGTATTTAPQGNHSNYAMRNRKRRGHRNQSKATEKVDKSLTAKSASDVLDPLLGSGNRIFLLFGRPAAEPGGERSSPSKVSTCSRQSWYAQSILSSRISADFFEFRVVRPHKEHFTVQVSEIDFQVQKPKKKKNNLPTTA